METFVDIAIWTAIILVIIAIAGSVLLPLINSLSNPKSLLKSLYGVLFVGAVFLVSYIISDNEVTANYITYNVTSPTTSKIVGAGLTTTIILAGIAAVGIVFSEINKAIKS